MAQLMPLPLTVSWFSKIQIGFTFLVPAYPGSTGQRVCVFVQDGFALPDDNENGEAAEYDEEYWHLMNEWIPRQALLPAVLVCD